MHPLWLLLLALVVPSLTERVVHPMPPEMLETCQRERLNHPLVSDLPYNSADQISPTVWVGNLCASRDEAFLLRNNITLAISAAQEHATQGYYGHTRYVYVSGLRDLPNDDFGVVSYAMHRALTIMADHERDVGGNILVYCNMGVSRSVTMAAAYLMQHSGMKFDNVNDLLGYIQGKRPVARPNAQYLIMLRLRWDSVRKQHQRIADALANWDFEAGDEKEL